MSSQHRLIVASRSLPFHGPGGMEYVAWDVARSLAGRGHPVTILTTRVPDRPAAFHEDGVDVVALQDAPPGRYSGAWWRDSRNWFRSEAPDAGAVLSVSAGAYGLLPDRYARPEVRFVMQAHGTALGDLRAKWGAAGLARKLSGVRNVAWLGRDLNAYTDFDHVVAVGPRVESQLRSVPVSWFLAGHRVVRIDNGIDTDAFRPDPARRAEVREALGLTEDDVVVVSVSRLHPQKGVLEALRGFASFARERGDAKYLVVGEGPARQALEAEAESLLASASYRLVGAADRRDVPGYLAAGDVFLFANLRAEVGLPLNVLEAAAVGLPLVLSHHVCPDLEPPLTAECVDPAKPAEVGAALARVVDGLESRAFRGSASRLPVGRSLAEAVVAYERLLFPKEAG